MNTWIKNKKEHDKYWGNLYSFLTKNSHNINDIKSEWLNLFAHEMGRPPSKKYLLNGEAVTTGFKEYTENKNIYLQNRINKYITPTTDAIIDLGSGWGRHSIQLAFNNPEYNIISGELSSSGRNINSFFKKKYNLNIEIFDFNWCDHKSLINLLSKSTYKEVIIFTSNTIEQIPEIDIKLFKDLLSLPINITAIHIEPVGWQYNGSSCPFAGSSGHYNKNLKQVLDNLIELKLIEIKKILPKYWGHDVGTTSQNNILIEWKKCE